MDNITDEVFDDDFLVLDFEDPHEPESRVRILDIPKKYSTWNEIPWALQKKITLQAFTSLALIAFNIFFIIKYGFNTRLFFFLFFVIALLIFNSVNLLAESSMNNYKVLTGVVVDVEVRGFGSSGKYNRVLVLNEATGKHVCFDTHSKIKIKPDVPLFVTLYVLPNTPVVLKDGNAYIEEYISVAFTRTKDASQRPSGELGKIEDYL